jgi:trimethylamine--corrinoid protein Co-methyltransferase
MSGNNVLYGAGMLECGMVVDFSQLLLDSDIIDMIKYFLGGVEVSDETLCVDEIKAGGQMSDFLMSPVTLKYMRTQSRPQFFGA